MISEQVIERMTREAKIDAGLQAAWKTRLFSCNRTIEDERAGMSEIIAAIEAIGALPVEEEGE